MNVIAALREYITKVVSEAAGMKVLLLDKETVCLLVQHTFLVVTHL